MRLRDINDDTHVISVDLAHSIDDGRISRHLYWCEKQGIKACRLHLWNVPNLLTKSPQSSKYNIVTFIFNPIYGRCRELQYLYISFINKSLINKCLKSFNINKYCKTIVHVHEPFLLIFCVALKHMFIAGYLVYDKHENYNSLLIRLVEAICKSEIDGVVVTYESGCCGAATQFPTSCITYVPNYPLEFDYIDLANKDIDSTQKVRFIYIGTLDVPLYDISLLLKIARYFIMKYSNVEFIIGGKSQNKKILDEFSDLMFRYPNNFKYVGYVDRTQVIKYTLNSTFGFQLLNPNDTRWSLTSSNKIYEYVHCSVIPIVRALNPDQSMLEEASLFLNPTDSDDVVIEKIEYLFINKDIIKMKKMKMKQLKSQLSFGCVSKNYSKLYEEIMIGGK